MEFTSPSSVAFSPDGSTVYVADAGNDSVTVFTRNSTTGGLTLLQTLRDGVAGVEGLFEAASVVVSPDGTNVYAAGRSDASLVVFARGPTGSLEFEQVLTGSVRKHYGLRGAFCVAVSPDGNYLYTAGSSEDAVGVFKRNPTTGRVSFVEALQCWAGVNDGLDGVRSVTVSPDGRHVYAAGESDDAVVAFSRDAATGRLTYMGALFDGVGGVDGLGGASDVALSGDGRYVYVAGRSDDAVASFSRDADTGQLTFAQVLKNGVGGVDGLDGITSVCAAGRHVYAVGYFDDAVALFRYPNDAPVLDSSGLMAMNPVHINDTSDYGQTVSTLLESAGGDRITDTFGDPEGIAVTWVDNTHGSWEYTIDDGDHWTAFGAPSAGSARLLAANDGDTRIRFVSAADYWGTVSPAIQFRAWDQATGANGGTGNAGINGGTTAYSIASETASVSVAGFSISMSPASRRTLYYTDPDGTEVTIALRKGRLVAQCLGDDFDTEFEGEGTRITGTNVQLYRLFVTDTTKSSRLTITTEGGTTPGASVYSLACYSDMGLISAPGLNLTGNFLTDYALTGLTLNNVSGGGRVEIGGVSSAKSSKSKLTLAFGQVQDLSIASQVGVRSLAASNWTDGDDRSATIRAPSLGTMTIGGVMDNVEVRTSGPISQMTLGAMVDSTVYAGVREAASGLLGSINEFSASSAIGGLTITGETVLPYSFVHSYVAAWQLGSVVLVETLEDNTSHGGALLGVSGHTLEFLACNAGRYYDRTGPAAVRTSDDFRCILY